VLHRHSLTAMSTATSTRIVRTAHESPVEAAMARAPIRITTARTRPTIRELSIDPPSVLSRRSIGGTGLRTNPAGGVGASSTSGRVTPVTFPVHIYGLHKDWRAFHRRSGRRAAVAATDYPPAPCLRGDGGSAHSPPRSPPPASRAELLHVLRLPDLDRAERIGEFWGRARRPESSASC
jgi:hypothetical protein